MTAARHAQDGRRRARSTRAPGVGVLAAIEGAALIAGNLIATPFVGRTRSRWGTVGTEATDQLPGDELVPVPTWSYTLGIDVDARPQEVWPWIAQIGQSRGGFYSYQTLENLAGCRIVNTTEILAEHQHPKVGDEIRLHPTAPSMRVEIVDPPRALVLRGSPSGAGVGGPRGTTTWQFAVTPGRGGGSRLLTRGRYHHAPDWRSRLTFGRMLLEPVTFVMSRRMMREVKRLAERHAGSAVEPRRDRRVSASRV